MHRCPDCATLRAAFTAAMMLADERLALLAAARDELAALRARIEAEIALLRRRTDAIEDDVEEDP